MPDTDRFAATAYEASIEGAGWKPRPWEALTEGEKRRWRKAADAVRALVRTELAAAFVLDEPSP